MIHPLASPVIRPAVRFSGGGEKTGSGRSSSPATATSVRNSEKAVVRPTQPLQRSSRVLGPTGTQAGDIGQIANLDVKAAIKDLRSWIFPKR